MAEEMTDPGQAAPEQTAPEQAASGPAAAAEAVLEQAARASAPAEKDKKEGGSALTVLTVLLVLVGAADLALWGLAGFYFLRGF
ncbi:hypothetical protein [Oscillibacter sp.]|uniref:hypothetical protein n=1 Tax=Oscillibacter sp. TaxID=1945593 RepID=UPI002D80DC65|nr:hypothetical protein [Oscillibacter sp.]